MDVDGRWSVEVPAADLQSLRDGNVPVNVNVVDAAGNTANITDKAVVDITPPSLSLLPFSGDGKVTVDELSAAQTVSGVTTPDQNGREVVVEINNQRFTTTVNSDGTWRIELPAGSLATLPSGEQSYTVTLTDSAGNSQQASGTVSVKSAQPLLSVDTFTGDNTLNAAEARTDQWLTGTTTNVEPGSKIVLVLANQEYSTLVDADGTWRIQLTAADLQKLAEGTNTLLVSVTDAYGQSTSQPYSFTVDKSVSAVAISIIADDDYLNQQESTEDLVVRGTSTGLPTGTAIEVNFGGTVYNATVEADGTWSVTIDAQALGELPDGELTITATATAPDNTTVNDSHLLNVVIASLPVPTLNEPFADGVLNLAERSQAQVITGTTGVTGAGQQVTVTLGGISYRGQVDADGAWSVTLPAGALTGLTEASSPVPLAITVTDAAGNAATLNESFTVDVTPPTISVLPFTGDDILNLAEAGAPQILRGEATGAEGGQPITVVINGITYQTTTSPQGTWELPVPAADLQALPNGPVAISITAVDSAGNPATLVACSLLSSRTLAPLMQLTMVFSRWQHAKTAMSGLNELLKKPLDREAASKMAHCPVLAGHYQFQNAQYSYDEEKGDRALSIGKLEIKPGERVAILGKVGAGKSTLLKLLSGQAQPGKGKVIIDGVDLAHIDPVDVRRQVGYLSQDSRLFFGTLRQNLMLGHPHATDAELLQALRISGALSMVQQDAASLDRLINEGGRGLSGGQRQMVLLSRLIVRNPQIVLMDEPTANMDEQLENLIIRQLHQWLTGRTLVLVTHRPALLALVDRIIVMENGQVVADGPRDDILKTAQRNSNVASVA